jgi:hypothetical protein
VHLLKRLFSTAFFIACKQTTNSKINVEESLIMSEETKVKTASNYTADNIQSLEGMEHVRMRPSMYIGDTGVRGLHHLVYEVVDNSIDEALAGYCDTIK